MLSSGVRTQLTWVTCKQWRSLEDKDVASLWVFFTILESWTLVLALILLTLAANHLSLARTVTIWQIHNLNAMQSLSSILTLIRAGLDSFGKYTVKVTLTETAHNVSIRPLDARSYAEHHFLFILYITTDHISWPDQKCKIRERLTKAYNERANMTMVERKILTDV